MFEPQLRRQRLRLKTSAWASGGPAYLGHKPPQAQSQ